MYKILHKQVIAQDIKKIDVAAPQIARRALPGQFVMVTPVPHERGIPMTIIDSDERRSMISLLVHEVGQATAKLGELSIGQDIYQVVGPLGRPSQIEKVGLVICVATGVGAAQILPVCRGLKKKGNRVIGIIGAKSKKVLMLEAQMRVVCDELFIATNDGSYERKGFASGLLKELLDKYTVHGVYAIGSVEMMQAAARMTAEKNIPLRVTLNPYMINGLGTCGSCRVKINGAYRLACTDGPEFDGHQVDFQDLTQRMKVLENPRTWAEPLHPNSPKSPGFAGLVKSLWASTRK
ncbi:MAG: sulfide/dihydroorotate dehydrogenase-like FAD/NAD-binding protein [Candidatus Omnitrophica bacterium]|nr:sulfide/dihydroorotate dehydrogenase-like FAD/NAD-binding protein [Candidatus Omnitrophota bacterium]MDE2223143.1 sulfide/dihydroorotate dehydrogenase-like FAD/NAD-binding protein [Candidatus Omnitrophota bacterium]